jgi:glyoxylate/hydroxypyruvate reductase A
MSILLISQSRDMVPYKEAMLQSDPNLDIEIWPNVKNKERVSFAVAWNHPGNVLGAYPNLKAVSSLGAGADHLLSDTSIGAEVNLCRVVAPSLAGQMADYCLTWVFNIIRNTIPYYEQQKAGEWKMLPAYSKQDLKIGVMGMGEIGSTVAKKILDAGFNVNGWSRSRKDLPGITSFTQVETTDFLASTNILICLLPHTPETEDILNLELFKKLQKPGWIINVGRGAHLEEDDLIYALDMNLLEGAVLDVFKVEPLPESHLFRGRRNIIITPHIAAVTQPEDVVSQLIENYKRVQSGMELLNTVSREKGY